MSFVILAVRFLTGNKISLASFSCNSFHKTSPRVKESKTVLDSGLHAVDSGFQLLDSRSFSVELGFRIPTAIFRNPRPKIPDSTSKNFPYSLTWVER